MMLADFSEIYPEAAQIFLIVNLISPLLRKFSGEEDWPFIESMLLGAEAIPPHSIPGETQNWYYTKPGMNIGQIMLNFYRKKKAGMMQPSNPLMWLQQES